MSDIRKDSKKDVQYKNAVSHSQNNLNIELFSDKYHSYLSKKIERLTSALYVITGFLSHDEPVRTRLRAASLDLLAQTSAVQSFTPDGIEAFRGKIAEVILFLRTAESAGLVSRMNASLLCDEYAQAGTFVKQYGKDIGDSETVETGERLLAESSSVNVRDFHVKDTKISKGQMKNTNKNGRDYRKKAILSLLDKKQKISIKDAVDAIEGCSEKTIQRELLALVEEGAVIKEGERRWSTYRRAPMQVATPQPAS